MRSIVNGTVTFGLVSVPVGVASATKTTNDPSFRILHAECKQPISVKRPAEVKEEAPAVENGGVSLSWCETCKKDAEETIRGYEYAKGEYVYFDDDEYAALQVTRGTIIEIKKFVKVTDIKPVMMANLYFLIPNKNNVLAQHYGLLYQALAETKLAGIGTQTLWGKEHPCALIANQDYEGGVLMMETLKPYEDLVIPDFAAPIPNAASKKLAKAMVTEYQDTFDPMIDLLSEQRIQMQSIIAAKIEGKEPPTLRDEERREAVPDIQEALRLMIAEKQNPKPEKKPRARAKAK